MKIKETNIINLTVVFPKNKRKVGPKKPKYSNAISNVDPEPNKGANDTDRETAYSPIWNL